MAKTVIIKTQYFNQSAFGALRNAIISVLVVVILLGLNCLFYC